MCMILFSVKHKICASVKGQNKIYCPITIQERTCIDAMNMDKK